MSPGYLSLSELPLRRPLSLSTPPVRNICQMRTAGGIVNMDLRMKRRFCRDFAGLAEPGRIEYMGVEGYLESTAFVLIARPLDVNVALAGVIVDVK